jgi:hypothetical protein
MLCLNIICFWLLVAELKRVSGKVVGGFKNLLIQKAEQVYRGGRG